MTEITEQDHLDHLKKIRWGMTRCINGIGLEINEYPGCIWPMAIKVVDDNKEYKHQYIKRVASKVKLDEINVECSFIFVFERQRKLIIPENITQYAGKIKDEGFLILQVGLDPLTIFQKVGHKLVPWKVPQKKPNSVAILRYGAIGDLMMASSVVKGLKDQGFHTTLYCSYPASQIVAHDPNIDEIVEQNKDHVRNGELGLYWEYLAAYHDRIIDLHESVERQWLPSTNDKAFWWPPELRQRHLNANYLEFHHELAQVPHKPQVKFYPTADEIKWAKEERAKMGQKVVVWSLGGSSVHKIFPHLDHFVARLMIEKPEVHVVLIGDKDCQALEDGWQEEPRVHCRSGQWTIRQSLTFIQQCADLAIGAETGVMNAVCCEPMPKIVFLSHSTDNNLTRDWTNTFGVSAPKEVLDKCKRCCLHRLHFNWDNIQRDETSGAAQCQANMDLEKIWDRMDLAIKTGKIRGHK